jgi:Flp pilus assembly protein CpaB
MKRARVIVFAIAITAVIGAAWIARSIVSSEPEVQQVEKTVGATDVLVAAKDINLGDSALRRFQVAAMADRRRYSGLDHQGCRA